MTSLARGAEACLAVGRDQLEVQHAAGLAARGSRRRPHVPAADALAALDARDTRSRAKIHSTGSSSPARNASLTA
jgi:hypothetical protein